MTGLRGSIRTGSGYAALLAVGLAAGFAWQFMQPEQKVRGASIPWLSNALAPAGGVSLPNGAGESALRALRPFALRGTIVSTDPSSSTAIFDLGKGEIHTLRPGATLPGVGRLLEVAEKGVYLEVDGRRLLFTFNDSTLARGEVLKPIESLVQGIMSSAAEGAVFHEGSAPAGGQFVVPASSIRYSDAPAGEPELNATPRPGQTIDTTVWD